jgi:hypothetical protein
MVHAHDLLREHIALCRLIEKGKGLMLFDPPALPLWLPAKPAIIRPANDVKRASFIPGMFPAAAAAAPKTPFGITYVATSKDASTATTFTFTNHSIGAADSSRIVVVGLADAGSGGNTISSVTIGGNSAAIAVQTSGTSTRVGIAYLAVPSGTTATIVATYSGSVSRCFVNVYSVVGAQNGTPFDTDGPAGGGTSSRSITIDAPIGGGVIAISTDGNADDTTWTNATEDNDDISNGFDGVSVAHYTTPGATETNKSITANSVRAVCGASWQ